MPGLKRPCYCLECVYYLGIMKFLTLIIRMKSCSRIDQFCFFPQCLPCYKASQWENLVEKWDIIVIFLIFLIFLSWKYSHIFPITTFHWRIWSIMFNLAKYLVLLPTTYILYWSSNLNLCLRNLSPIQPPNIQLKCKYSLVTIDMLGRRFEPEILCSKIFGKRKKKKMAI